MINQSSYGFKLIFRPHDVLPEICINRLGATTQIFIAMDYWILISEKYLQFRKNKSMQQGIFFPPCKSNWIQVVRKIFSNYVYLKDMYKNLKEIEIIQCVSKLTTFLNLQNFELRRSLQ